MTLDSSSTPNPGLAHAESGTSPPSLIPATMMSPPYVPANVARRRHTDPALLAQRYLQTTGRDPKGRLTIHYWRGEWWRYSAGRHSVIPDKELRGELAAFIQGELERENAIDRSGFRPVVRNSVVADVMLALQGRTQLAGEQEQPFGIGLLKGETGFIAFQNGLYQPDPNGQPVSCHPRRSGSVQTACPTTTTPRLNARGSYSSSRRFFRTAPTLSTSFRKSLATALFLTPASRSSSCFRVKERTGRACYWTR